MLSKASVNDSVSIYAQFMEEGIAPGKDKTLQDHPLGAVIKGYNGSFINGKFRHPSYIVIKFNC